jgi:hypothetical protein
MNICLIHEDVNGGDEVCHDGLLQAYLNKYGVKIDMFQRNANSTTTGRTFPQLDRLY